MNLPVDTGLALAIDLLLAAGLVGLALQVVAGKTLFRSIVIFVVYGLVMALAWARLNAPDLAMAEAAIGAGITGALLLVTYRRLVALEPSKRRTPYLRSPWLAAPVGLLTGVLVGLIGWASLAIAPGDTTAGTLARHSLADTGVGNPVTGVLLIFRGYDTLLEMAVLLLAFLGARAISQKRDLAPDSQTPVPEVALVGALLGLVVPMTLLVGIYLLRAGGHAPGGAFQAGAVLAAGAVLLGLTGRLVPVNHTPLAQRLILILGLVTFSVFGLIMMMTGSAMLALPGTWAIYLIETVLMISIALPLALLFAQAPGLKRRGH